MVTQLSAEQPFVGSNPIRASVAMGKEQGVLNKESLGKGLELSGIIGAIIGLATLQPEIILFSGVAWYGGKKLKGGK